MYLPDTNEVFFSAFQTATNLLINLNGSTPMLNNVSFTPPIYSVNGGTLFNGGINVAASNYQNQTGGIFVVDPMTLQLKLLINNYRGFHSISPDDLVVTRDGGMFFTDPSFGSVAFGGPPPQVGTYVYYFKLMTGALKVVEDLTDDPNGIALSADQKTLYLTTAELLGTGLPGTPLDPLRIFLLTISSIARYRTSDLSTLAANGSQMESRSLRQATSIRRKATRLMFWMDKMARCLVVSVLGSSPTILYLLDLE